MRWKSTAQFILSSLIAFVPVHASPNCTTEPSSIFGLKGIKPDLIVEDACVSYSALDKLNLELAQSLNSITESTDFFSYYRLNLYHKTCPFWSDSSGMCGNIACAVNTIDNENEIPPVWRATELGKLQGPTAGHPSRSVQIERPKASPFAGNLGDDVDESCVFEDDDECDDRDYCLPEDESATAKGEYVSLLDNPEKFTGYKGPGARQVWEAIYRENCFSKTKTQVLPASKVGPFGSQASSDLKNLIAKSNQEQAILGQLGGKPYEQAPFVLDDECLEKRVFYRIISGMHASISTHICWNYLNQTTGQWGPNPECYQQRLQTHPERVANLYFNYALLLEAVGKLNDYVKSYSFCSGDPQEDRETKRKVMRLTQQLSNQAPIFDESLMFREPGAGIELKKDFRNRFRNVARTMDCVTCDKCRLWGKLQTNGYGTALKVLLELDDATKQGETLQIKRTELVALFNTLQKVSNSLHYLRGFERIGEGIDATKALDAIRVEPTDAAAEQIEPLEDAKLQYNSFREEWNAVWRMWWYVMESWFAIPGLVYEITILELSRTWNVFIGLPVGPRAWTFEKFNPKEL